MVPGRDPKSVKHPRSGCIAARALAIIFRLPRRLLLAGFWLAPPLFALYVYWHGLLAWFQQDDFVWLGLLAGVTGPGELMLALFQPTAHGTWRPLSERAFFLAFQSMFGYNALPFHIWVFLTQCVNFTLMSSILLRLTASRLAAVAAPMLWIANSKLMIAMSWPCEYILALCAFFLLLAFHFLLRHIETGERRYYVFMWFAFLAGFGAMESNVVFPMLAASYTLLCAPRYFRKTLPLLAASAAYTVFHFAIAPRQPSGPYAMHFDISIVRTFWSYWRWAFEPLNMNAFTGLPEWSAKAFMAMATLALIVWVARQSLGLPHVLVLWFGILLAPVLPLRDHVTDYYLTLPLIALAMLAACALARAYESTRQWKILATVLLATYLAQSVPSARGAAKWWHDRTIEAKRLVLPVFALHEKDPARLIVLEGVDDTLFWSAVAHYPFRLPAGTYVYLAPGSEARVAARPETGFDVANFVLPAGRKREDFLLYNAATGRLGEPPSRRVDAADPAQASHLGAGWYEGESGHRWMSGRATVRMAAPSDAAQRLYLNGYCPAALLSSGPVGMTVLVDGQALQPARLTAGDQPFTFDFALSTSLAGKLNMEVAVELERTFRVPSDTRDLGVTFGVFEIR